MEEFVSITETNEGKGKGKGCLLHAREAQGRYRYSCYHVQPQCWKVWVVNATPQLLCPWKRPGTHLKKAEWASMLIWMDVENLAPTGFKLQSVQPVAVTILTMLSQLQQNLKIIHLIFKSDIPLCYNNVTTR